MISAARCAASCARSVNRSNRIIGGNSFQGAMGNLPVLSYAQDYSKRVSAVCKKGIRTVFDSILHVISKAGIKKKRERRKSRNEKRENEQERENKCIEEIRSSQVGCQEIIDDMDHHRRPDGVAAPEQPAEQQCKHKNANGCDQNARLQPACPRSSEADPDPVGPVYGCEQQGLQDVCLPELHMVAQLRQHKTTEHDLLGDRREKDLRKGHQPRAGGSLEQGNKSAPGLKFLEAEHRYEIEQAYQQANGQPPRVDRRRDVQGHPGTIVLQPQNE